MTAGPVETVLSEAIGAALRDTLPTVVDDLVAVGGPRAYSVAEVARRLDVSTDTVRRLIAAGHLVTVPHLSPTRVAARTLDAFLVDPGDGARLEHTG